MGFMRNIAPFMGLSGGETIHTIVPASNLFLDNITNTTDSTTVNVTPDTMSTTSTKIDTGDGTTWFKITSGSTATGDFTLTVILFGTAPTSNKSAKVRISDNDGFAADADVIVRYTYII